MVTSLRSPRYTIVDRAFPTRSLAVQAALIIAGSLLVALLAQVAIKLPFTPIPITGQTYGVLLVGALLGSNRGALSLLLYLGEGGLRLPVYAGGASGWPLGVTGGYLLGFIVAAYVVGYLSERGWDRRLITAAMAMVAGDATIYLVGLPWLAAYVGWSHVVSLGLVPFLPGDVLKVLLATASLPLAWYAGQRMRR